MSQSPIAPEQLEFDLRDRLHKSLRAAGMSGQDLAIALGVHRNTINRRLMVRPARAIQRPREPVGPRSVPLWPNLCPSGLADVPSSA